MPQHVGWDQQLLSDGLAFQLRNQVLPRNQARHGNGVPEKVVDNLFDPHPNLWEMLLHPLGKAAHHRVGQHAGGDGRLPGCKLHPPRDRLLQRQREVVLQQRHHAAAVFQLGKILIKIVVREGLLRQDVKLVRGVGGARAVFL